MGREKTRQKKKRGRSIQEMIDIKTFTKYGLATNKAELLFYLVSPTNISVLSYTNIEIKIRHLMMVLSAIPDIEINCMDSSKCFDDNKAYLHGGQLLTLSTCYGSGSDNRLLVMAAETTAEG